MYAIHIFHPLIEYNLQHEEQAGSHSSGSSQEHHSTMQNVQGLLVDFVGGHGTDQFGAMSHGCKKGQRRTCDSDAVCHVMGVSP